MSKNINQVFTANPIATNQSTDLMYFGRSPYGATNDAAMTYANFANQFTSTISGTANQVLVNGTTATPQTGAITLTLPQSIAITSSPTFNSVSGGNLTLSGNTLSTTNTNGNLNFLPNGDGQLLFGSQTPILTSSASLDIMQIANGNVRGFNLLGAYTNDSLSAGIITLKSRSTTVGGVGSVLSTDTLGGWLVYATDGTSLLSPAGISCVVDGAVSTGIIPTLWKFQNTSTSGSTNTTFTIDPSGNIVALGSITPSQTGGIIGTTTNNNANAGSVGESISSTISSGSAVSITSGTPANITSISLTAGNWIVYPNVVATASVSLTAYNGWASTTSATLPDASLRTSLTATTGSLYGFSCPVLNLKLSTTTTVYLSVQTTFSGTGTAYGQIQAIRIR